VRCPVSSRGLYCYVYIIYVSSQEKFVSAHSTPNVLLKDNAFEVLHLIIEQQYYKQIDCCSTTLKMCMRVRTAVRLDSRILNK